MPATRQARPVPSGTVVPPAVTLGHRAVGTPDRPRHHQATPHPLPGRRGSVLRSTPEFQAKCSRRPACLGRRAQPACTNLRYRKRNVRGDGRRRPASHTAGFHAGDALPPLGLGGHKRPPRAAARAMQPAARACPARRPSRAQHGAGRRLRDDHSDARGKSEARPACPADCCGQRPVGALAGRGLYPRTSMMIRMTVVQAGCVRGAQAIFERRPEIRAHSLCWRPLSVRLRGRPRQAARRFHRKGLAPPPSRGQCSGPRPHARAGVLELATGRRLAAWTPTRPGERRLLWCQLAWGGGAAAVNPPPARIRPVGDRAGRARRRSAPSGRRKHP